MPPLPVPEDVAATELTRRGAVRLPFSLLAGTGRMVGGAVAVAGRAARNPVHAAGRVARFANSLQRVVGSPPVEPSPMLRRRSLNRRFETVEVAFDDLRRAAKDHGCSVNDAYIAALCGALRRYHEQLGAPIDSLPLVMPVSLRSGDDPAGGNQWAGVRIAAPIAETDPVRRMHRIRKVVISGRSEPAINALGAIAPVLACLPIQMVLAMGAGTIGDVQASNVPGHAQDTYLGGSKVLKNFPFGPLPGAAMMVVMLSHVGRCYVGVNYDTTSITEHDLFARCLVEGFDEVIAASTSKSKRTAVGA